MIFMMTVTGNTRSLIHSAFVSGYRGLSGLRTQAGRWGRRWSVMSSSGVLVDCRRGLCAAVAICTLELQCGDAMLTTGAFEERTAVHRFGRVISHVLFQPPLSVQSETRRVTIGRHQPHPC